MTRNSPAKIALRHSGLLTEPRDQAEIQKIFSEWPHTVQKQEVDHFARLVIAELCLRAPNFLPRIDRLAHHTVHGFRERCSCLVHRNIQEAYWRRVVSLPTHTPNTQSADFVTSES